MQLDEHDWVLHIDEETLLDDYCIQSCVGFITKQDHADVGQGVIHFNCHNYWSSVFTGVADVSRVKNDFGDVQWRLNWLGKAAVGIRGSFLLIRGSVENACSWDTDSLTEDYAFCLEAIRKGYRMGFVPGIARELSPSCIGDLIRQRRRWYTGVQGLGDFWGQLFLFRTAITGLQAFNSVACWFLVYPWSSWTVQQPWWVYNWTVFETSIGIGITAWTLFLQDYDTGLSLEDMLAHQVLAVLVQPFVQIAEGYAVLMSTFFPDTWFFVIKKT
ncbi:glycosyl transferase family group 2-domain-containing protein [Paraphoma chrysanthemicola]|nr:glycosyl transferase family group 2-domain-containing protein [Paraphoma chrysanthemicola]